MPLGLLHMRPIQRWFNSHRLHPVKDRCKCLTVTRDLTLALKPWREEEIHLQGVGIGHVITRIALTTDASKLGWGAICQGHSVRGIWTDSQKSQHINVLELLAVQLALKHFQTLLTQSAVLIRSDNTATVAYINHQEGLRSTSMMKVARDILMWAHAHSISLKAVYLPGKINHGADMLSRGGPVPGEWRLHPRVVQMIWQRFGRAQVDLFASRDTTHCPLWFSIRDREAPLGVDALASRWPDMILYAFPPIRLIPAVLDKIRAERTRLLLVAPRWESQVWFASLITLLDGPPWEIPVYRDLLSQAYVCMSGP